MIINSFGIVWNLMLAVIMVHKFSIFLKLFGKSKQLLFASSEKKQPNILLIRDIQPPNNQYCFPQFFPRIFLSFGPMKICFLFQLLLGRNIRGKNWGKQYWLFGESMSRTRYTFRIMFQFFIH